MLRYLNLASTALLKPVKAKDSIIHLQVEPTTICNLKCSFCSRENTVKQGKNMELDDFRHIFDSVKPKRVTFAGAGEPLLHPQIISMVKYVKENGASPVITSNFTLGQRLADELVSNGLEGLRVSIDAASRDRYISVRGRDYFDRVLAGISLVNQVKKRYNRTVPGINLEFVLLHDSLSEMQDFVRLAAELDVDKVNFRPLNLVGIEERRTSLEPKLSIQDLNDLLVETEKLSKSIGVDTNIPDIRRDLQFYLDRYEDGFVRARGPVCLYPWIQMFVSVEGEVAPCCALKMDENVSMGNILKEPFDQVWNGDRYRRLRKDSREHAVQFKSCETCIRTGFLRLAKLAFFFSNHHKS